MLHLPVRGSGDGGIYSTAADISSFWTQSLRGPDRVRGLGRGDGPPPQRRARMSSRYGLGFWLHETSDAVMLEGYDAGVSFRSVHDPSRGITHTVISNTSEGAWPIARFFAELQT